MLVEGWGAEELPTPGIAAPLAQPVKERDNKAHANTDFIKFLKKTPLRCDNFKCLPQKANEQRRNSLRKKVKKSLERQEILTETLT